jgi:cytochrome c-type biogenesis protein CcmH/NrfG
VAVFVAGFIAGIVFSAWKLQHVGRPEETKQSATASPAFHERIKELRSMIAASPDNVSALIQLGNLYFDTNEYDQAVELYEKALQLSPEKADVQADLGIAYRRLGAPEKSAQSFEKALEIDEDHAMALFNLGIVLRDDLNKPQKALQTWRKWLAKHGDTPHAVMVRPWVQSLENELRKQSSPQDSQPRPEEPAETP